MNKHRVSVAEEAVTIFDCLRVGLHHQIATGSTSGFGEGTDQHQQRGLGQVKVCQQRIDDAEVVRWVDEWRVGGMDGQAGGLPQ